MVLLCCIFHNFGIVVCQEQIHGHLSNYRFNSCLIKIGPVLFLCITHRWHCHLDFFIIYQIALPQKLMQNGHQTWDSVKSLYKSLRIILFWFIIIIPVARIYSIYRKYWHLWYRKMFWCSTCLFLQLYRY